MRIDPVSVHVVSSCASCGTDEEVGSVHLIPTLDPPAVFSGQVTSVGECFITPRAQLEEQATTASQES